MPGVPIVWNKLERIKKPSFGWVFYLARRAEAQSFISLKIKQSKRDAIDIFQITKGLLCLQKTKK